MLSHHSTSTNDEEGSLKSKCNPSSILHSTYHECRNCYEHDLNQIPKAIGNDNDGTSSDTTSGSTNDSTTFMTNFLSNISFFAGSTCYVVTSVWDLIWYANIQQLDDDYYACERNDGDDCEKIVSFDLDLYTITSILGASLMIANASFDFYQCQLLSRSKEEIDSLWHRDIRSDFLAALAFGVAAIIELATIFFSGDVFQLINVATIVSSLIYLLSAILSLVDTTLCNFNLSRERKLCLVGDWLFLIGSLIDVMISIASEEHVIKVDGWTSYGWNVFSSVLWLTDAGKTSICR